MLVLHLYLICQNDVFKHIKYTIIEAVKVLQSLFKILVFAFRQTREDFFLVL